MAGHVLVTGAGGLLGRALLDALPADLDVTTVSSTDVDLLGHGAFATLVRDTHPDVLVHLAWVASSTPGYRTSPDNARWRTATREVVAAAREVGTHVVAVGTGLDAVTATDDYTAAKAGLRDDLADDIAAGQIAWARPHYVFDPATPSPAVLRAAAEAQRRGEAVRLASPYAQHDFVHVRDVATALAAVVDHRLTGVVDIGQGVLTAVHTLVERFGASWAEADDATSTVSTDAAADVSRLVDSGWHPTETERFLS